MAVESIDAEWLRDALEHPGKLRGLEVHDVSLSGISYEAAAFVKDLYKITDAQLSKLLGISPKTLDRRKEKQTLEPDESERVLRAIRVFATARQVLQSKEHARSWLTRRQPQLGERVPLDLLQTDIGTNQVITALQRIQHSIPV